MPRIRSIKPDLLRSPKFGHISPAATGCLLGLFPHVDDAGRYAYSWQLVKADVWPMNDKVDQLAIVKMIEELVAAKLLCWYWDNGRAYFHFIVTDWAEWQKIDHPSASRFPECPREQHGGREHRPEDSEFLASLHEPSRGGVGTASPSSTASDQEFASPREPSALARARWKGREGKGEERKDLQTIVEQVRPAPADIEAVFDAWKATLPPGSRHVLTLERRHAIKAALLQYPLDDVLDAVRGWQNDPWEERSQHNDVGQLLWMGTKRKPQNVLEKMRDLWRNGPPAVSTNGTRAAKHRAQVVQTHQQMDAWAKEVDARANGGGGMAVDGGQAQRELPRPGDRA